MLLYRIPGPLRHKTRGFLYAEIACTEATRAGLLADGWCDTLEQAAGLVPADDDAPPTREEMEAEAARLGLKYHHKTGDAKLLALINAAHGEA